MITCKHVGLYACTFYMNLLFMQIRIDVVFYFYAFKDEAGICCLPLPLKANDSDLGNVRFVEIRVTLKSIHI